jgi:hypothetical protein
MCFSVRRAVWCARCWSPPKDERRGVWLTLLSDLAQAYFQVLALDVVG